MTEADDRESGGVPDRASQVTLPLTPDWDRMRAMTRVPTKVTHALEEAFEAIYQAGWDDAMAALAKARPGGASAVAARIKRPTIAAVKSRVTAREAVLEGLHAQRGMQAAEIFEWSKAKGMNVTFAAIRTAIKRLRKKGQIEGSGAGYALMPGVQPAPAAKTLNGKKEPPPDTDAWRVLNAIRTSPGLPSAKIKVIAEGRGKTINPKTFKTALRRLRSRGFARRTGGCWFAERIESAA